MSDLDGLVTVDRKYCPFLPTDIIKLSDAGPVETHPYAFQVILPQYLHDWDIRDYWEKERILHMQKHLKKGDIIFDIGAEHGYMTALLAEMVGGENVVIFEPSEVFWPGLRAIWEENKYPTPKDTFLGFVGDKTSEIDKNEEAAIIKGWPQAAWSDTLCVRSAYRYIHEPAHAAITQSITLDDYFAYKGIAPDAITMDIEGAELKALFGAAGLLKRFKPQCWISVHPDLAEKNYDTKSGEVVDFMESIGYTSMLIATDHEEHWYFV